MTRFGLIAGVLVAGCADGTGGGQDRSLDSVYREDQVDRTCRPDNLLVGGGFEAELPGLLLCGAATVQSDRAPEGNRALRLRTDGEDCRPPTLGIGGLAAHALVPLPDVDFVGTSYTIRFRMRVVDSSPNTTLWINLTQSSDPDSLFSDQLMRLHEGPYPIDGTVQYNLVWEADGGLSGSLDPDQPVYLEFELDPQDDLTDIVIDSVEVVPSGYYPCAEPMEDAFVEQARDLELVAVDPDNDEFVVFRGDGSDARSLDLDLIEGYRFVPGFWSDDRLVYPEITFNPQLPDSLDVVPASGTDVRTYDLDTGNRALVYQTLGSPGFYQAYSSENRDALDIEVRQSVYDPEREVGILTICGRNRQVYGVTSDDLCLLNVVNEAFEDVESETQGFSPSLSPAAGLVAFYDFSVINLADYSAEGVGPATTVYQSSGIGTLASATSISPDGSTVVFADALSVEWLNYDGVQWSQSLFAYDVDTGRTRMLHPMDHGLFAYGFAWTADSAYLVYSVLTLDGGAETWWLNVNTGTTGPITTEVRTIHARGKLVP